MTTTVKEQITLNIYQTLATISQLAGFSADAQVEREAVRGNIPKDREIILIDEGDTPTDSPLQKDDFTARYTLVLYLAVSDASVAPNPDAELSRFAADVRKSLMADHTRGAWAFNTMPGQETQSETTREGYQSRQLSLEVQYRTALNDPFSQ